MFDIQFYKDKNGKSEIIDYLDMLQEQAKTSKNAKINREKILIYLKALSEYGTRIGHPVVKHIDGDIWEIRPLRTRIFFFYWKDNKFILLHYYMKKTQKTPVKEIEKAYRNLNDFLERNGES